MSDESWGDGAWTSARRASTAASAPPATPHAQARRRAVPRDHTEVAKIFSRRQEIEYAFLVVAWISLSLYFWLWWLEPGHRGNLLLFPLVSVSLSYGFSLLPSFYLFYLGWMRRPLGVSVDNLPAGTVECVAVVTLTVPGSESIDMVGRQLKARVAISYPHDSWILVDKEPSVQIQQVAEELGVY